MPANAMTVQSSTRRQHACVDPLEIHIPMVRNYSETLTAGVGFGVRS
jgi:hypothetical protein